MQHRSSNSLRRYSLFFIILPIVSLAIALILPANGFAGSDVVYEIFVRSFFDGDNDSKGIGDLKGVLKQLDYLNDGKPDTNQDLEVDILWLMPIFPSPTYHGYDVTDYRTIHPEYGTLDDFKALLKEAHKRNMRVILDVPFNHTSNQHEWFQKAVADPQSPYRAYYRFEPKSGDCKPSWHPDPGQTVCYLGVFSPTMPDLNFDNAQVKKEVKNIAKYWLAFGVDGFRLDAAKHIYGESLDEGEPDILHNNDWWLEFSKFVYSQKPKAILIGEVLGDDERLRRHAWGLDGLVDEPFMDGLRYNLGHPSKGFVAHYKHTLQDARDLNKTAYQSSFPFPDQPFQFYPYVASHDRNPRLASDLEEMRNHGMNASVDQAYRVAMYVLLTVGSRPILYSGDELMQKGWKWNGNSQSDPDHPGDGSGLYDETLREPFPWYKSGQGPGQTKWLQSKYDGPDDGVSREEQTQSGEMLDLVRALTNLRTKHPTLATGEIGAVVSDDEEWMVFERKKSNDRYLILINRTASSHDYRFHQQWYPEYIGAKEIFVSDGTSKQWKDFTNQNKSIQDAVSVPAFGLVILRHK
jgi:alpha-amylase